MGPQLLNVSEHMSNAPEQKYVLFTILKWTFEVIQSKNDCSQKAF